MILWIFLWAAHGNAQTQPTPMILGTLGLNTAPSARMDEAGTLRAGVSGIGRNRHFTAGFQFSDGIYLSLRQTKKPSSNDEESNFSPGADLKLRLWRESKLAPEIALGFNGIVGQSAMAGEYLTFSKRYRSLDATLGVAWARDRDDTGYNAPKDWFSSGNAGMMGGIEYDLPVPNLSVKLDYNRSYGQKVSPWGVSLSYAPKPWIQTGIGMQGTDAVMARLSFSNNPQNWKLKNQTANKQKTDWHTQNNTQTGKLNIPVSARSTPALIGATLRDEQGHDGEGNIIELHPTILNLRGPSIRLPRESVEKMTDKSGITLEELWKNAEFKITDQNLSASKTEKQKWSLKADHALYLTLDNQISLSEPETGVIYRSSLLAGTQSTPFLAPFSIGGAVRLNIADNFSHLADHRGLNLAPVRSNMDDFTKERISLDNLHISAGYTLHPNIHTLITTGYIEEQYFGSGGEIIFRPFSSRFAIGAEGWILNKRDPQTIGNLGLTAEKDTSFLINGWYDLPHADLTLSASAGKFLGADLGVSAGLNKTFDNGVRLGGFITVTDSSDIDATGEPLHAYHGVNLNIPLGSLPHLGAESYVNTEIAPQLRNVGQRVRAPLRLYDLTETFSLKHLSRHWSDLMPE